MDLNLPLTGNRFPGIWRILQVLVWLIGATIFLSLVLAPDLGIHLFWNGLIPVAPALLVLAAGVWRNICPLASTSLLPAYLFPRNRKKLTTAQSATLNLVAVGALLLIVPMRHVLFDTSGPATAMLLLGTVSTAVVLGFRYEWKSAWCSGLCPVHPVEKLYGHKTAVTPKNVHCAVCTHCVAPCPDSTPGIHPMSAKKTPQHRIAGFLMVAAFPGFVWGWFQTPDHHGEVALQDWLMAYLFPVLGMVISSLLYLLLERKVEKKPLVAVFSAATVSCYYWFRIPALLGFGLYPGDGMLVNLQGTLPEWLVTSVAAAAVLFFFWWLVIRKVSPNAWMLKPAKRVVKG